MNYSQLSNDDLRYVLSLEVNLREAKRTIHLILDEYVDHVHENMFTMVRQMDKIAGSQRADRIAIGQAEALRKLCGKIG